jgi:glucose-1-phosphate cytidylyltransferase
MLREKVVLLAGGQGTRMREETEYRPKPMVTIGRWPVLWHIMRIFSSQGFNDFVVCLGYKGEMIKEYFSRYHMMASDFTVNLAKNSIEWHDDPTGDIFDWKITLAETGLSAMTGARLKKVEKYITGETFMLTYGDGVADVDVKALLAFHKSHGKIATVTGVNPPSRFGDLIIDNGRVVKFSEKSQVHGGVINGGFFVFNRKIFDYLNSEDPCILEKKPLETLAAEGQLMVYSHGGFWQCMDTLRDVQFLNSLWDKGDAPWVSPVTSGGSIS